MDYKFKDNRVPLAGGTVIEMMANDGRTVLEKYTVSTYINCSALSMNYIAVAKDLYTDRTTGIAILKELFPAEHEGCIPCRGEDGSVRFCDPIGSTEVPQAAAMEYFTEYYRREKELSDRAKSMYNNRTGEILGTDEGVLDVKGPRTSRNGNRYLVTKIPHNTKFLGYFMSDSARDGFGRLQSLDTVLEILTKAADKLSYINGNRRLAHLGLSHSNIYAVSSDDTRISDVYIIDYANALIHGGYNNDQPEMLPEAFAEGFPENVRFTSNEYSAPEVLAIAATEPFMREGSGYALTPSADTYSLAAILFRAVYGFPYEPKSYYEQFWRVKAYERYPRTAFPEFADRLVAFFEQALNPDPALRFKSAARMSTELSALSVALESKGVFTKLDQADFMPYLLMNEYPLYDYADKNGDVGILCVGHSLFVKRLLTAAMSCGQSMEGKLRFCIAAQGSAQELKRKLLESSPALAQYSNINGDGTNPHEYISIEFFEAPDLTAPEAAEKVAELFGSACRYTAVDLGAKAQTQQFVKNYAPCLSARAEKKALLLYHTAARAAVGDEKIKTDGNVKNVQIVPFGENLDKYVTAGAELEKLAQKTDLFIAKSDNPRMSARMRYQAITTSLATQKSALSMAVHYKYKLKYLGINPKKDAISIASAYLERLDDPETYGRLLELEHRRWMMFAISEGFRAPSAEDFDSYAYRFEGKVFNRGLDSRLQKLNHRLVPCSKDGIVLPEEPAQLAEYTDPTSEKAAGLDELDRMSVLSYTYLQDRVNSKKERDEILARFEDGVSAQVAAAGTEKEAMLTKAVSLFLDELEKCMKSKDMGTIDGELSYLGKVFSNEALDIGDACKRLKNELTVFLDYSSFTDLKAQDAVVIEGLPQLLCVPEHITLIKPYGRMKIDNVAAALILKPDTIVYFGKEDDGTYKQFFNGRGMELEVSEYQCERGKIDEYLDELSKLAEQCCGRVVIDITGSAPMHVAAAMMLAAKMPSVSIVRCDEKTQRIENVCGFDLAFLYRSNYEISVRESYGLFGAKEKKDDGKNGLEDLGDSIPELWKIYLKYRDRWEKLINFISTCEKDEFYTSQLPHCLSSDAESFTKKLTVSAFDNTGIEPILRFLEKKNTLKKLKIDRSFRGFVTVSFDMPVRSDPNNYFAKHFSHLFDKLYDQKLEYILQNSSDKGNTFRICSGRYCQLKGTKIPDSPFEEVLPILEELERIGLIYIIKTPVKRTAGYTDFECMCSCSAVPKLFTKTGNVLEAYVWYAAKKAGYFDDVRANFSFTWLDPDINNELDVILTKGLTSIVISCKATNRADNMHLYEINHLTEHFTVNSKAVMVYALEKSQLENTLKRAAAMGISLVTLEDLESTEKLIARLCSICDENIAILPETEYEEDDDTDDEDDD